jgi:chromosome segregation ATPase
MARQIVTQQSVTEAAEVLMLEGSEPSIVAVQARIGGGSFSTVKRFLDVWKQMMEQAAAVAPDTPAEVQARGQEFTRAVWILASREAQRQTQQAKDEAHAEVSAVRAELTQATSEIARLEGVEAEQCAAIEQHQTRLRESELALAQAQTQARRVSELEETLVELRSELSATRSETTRKAVEAGKLSGEVETLRTQVRELMSAIQPQQAKK